jgi:hypothetical protein
MKTCFLPLLLLLAGPVLPDSATEEALCRDPGDAEQALACAHALEELRFQDGARFMAALLSRTDLEAKALLLTLHGDTLEVDERERLLVEARAGAALQPRLLAILQSACIRWPEPDAGCEGLVERIVALEPSNAWTWMQRAGMRHRAGDAEGARADLLASGRSSHYQAPARELLRIAWEARLTMPPNPELVRLECLDLLAARSPGIDRAAACAAVDPLDLAAGWQIGVAMAQPSNHLAALRPLCLTAQAARDGELLGACRRLARMLETQGSGLLDVLLGLSLQAEIGATPEIGAAVERQAALRAMLDRVGRYADELESVLGSRAFIEVLLDHGEVRALEWLLQRVETSPVR